MTDQDDPPLEVGVIGFGLGGASFHAPLIDATSGLRLAAVVTSNPERRRAVHERYPHAATVESVAGLWALTPPLDVVVVTSPNASHAPLAREALAHGCHVVVDKPFAGTAAEVREIAHLAENAGRLAIPYQNRRWDGDFLTIQRLLADGAFGDLYRLESRYERWRGAPKPRWCDPDARRDVEGILYDLGSHLIDQALVLFGPAREVYAELERRHPEVYVEDEAFVSLLHENGVRSQLHVSAMAAQPGPRFTVRGSRAAYVKYGLDVQEDALRAGAVPGGAAWGEEPPDRWGTLGMESAHQPVRTEPGNYLGFYAGVVDAIRRDAPPPVPIVDAVAMLEVVEAAFLSAWRRRVVRLSEMREALPSSAPAPPAG